MAKVKKGNWIVKMKCEVYKDVFCDNCTEDDARYNPWEFATSEIETDQIDWHVERVEHNE
jgi:hypothetical protein